MSDGNDNLVVRGNESQWLLPSKSIAHVAIKRALPNITIVIHGVNDVGEAFPNQERGLCEGLNDRLFRDDICPGEWALPPEKKSGTYTAADVSPDPDKVYFQRKPDAGTSPVIPFYWGFREEAAKADTSQRHGEYLDRFGNRIDKRFGKNGGPFANATTNIPDMFGPGFRRNRSIKIADPNDGTHPLLSAPPRTYMVLAAQRLANLLRIIRKKSPNEPINIVAHSQGCFVTLLAHAMLAKGGDGVKADTIVLNNPPYSLDEPFVETFQTGYEQQTSYAREETLRRIVADYITAAPATVPAFAELKKLGDGVVGREWAPDARKERDNRGKLYLYFSPDDGTVGLPNILGIGWWGVYEAMRVKLGKGFYQRLFASPTGANPDVPEVGSDPFECKLHFKRNVTPTAPRKRTVNAEALVVPFRPDLGPATLSHGAIDAAIATTNTYEKKGQEGILSSESPAAAQARWLNGNGSNSYHSGIVSNPVHSRKATAYDISIGVSEILKDNDQKWIRFLRAAADWRSSWCASASDPTSEKADPSSPPVSPELVAMLESEISATARDVILANYDYHATGGKHPGVLPDMTLACNVQSLAPHIVSQTVNQVIAAQS